MGKMTIAIGFAFALATIGVGTANAESGGPLINDQGQCRQLGPNNNNQMFYSWGSCPSNLSSQQTSHVHPERVTPGAAAVHTGRHPRKG
jgi:hypothetical protein